ncbi:MAG TPA: hypothetical protein PLF91_14150, partial [Mycolicibacterium fallax]|nr:hypothetical protein [Mycolicibacterium fallax]
TNSDTADGDITLENTGADLIANTVTAGGSGDVLLQTLVSGDVYVNNITAWADLITVNSAGRIDESGADGGADLTAAELDLNATTGIGVGGALEVSASTIAADSVGSGAVNLNSLATGPVLVTSLTTGTFGGAIEVGAITFSQTGNQPLTVQLASTQEGDISIANAGADLTVYEATAGAAAGSNISNLALSATGGGADVFIDNLRAEDDQISITAPLGEIAEIGMGDPEIDLTARILSLIAYTGIGAANPIETDAEELGADNYTNAIQIDNTGDLVLRGVTDDYGDIWIYTEGDLTVQNMTIGYQTVVESVFGNVELYASEDILVNDNVRGLGDVLLVADATRATAFAAGPVSLGLYAPENELGGIYMAGGTSVTSSGSGVVELVASEDIELGLVAAGAGTGIIYSGLGAIIDNNLDDNNVLAEDLVMHANLGIGTLADRLETAVTNLAAENITSGELALTNTASQDNWPVPGDGIPELILATLLDVNTPIGGLTLSVDGLTNLGGGVHLRELAGDILDNVPPTTEVIPFSMDVVANGNSTLESDNGVIGWWNDPLEVNVVGSLTAGALGDPSRNHLISVNLAGIVTPSDQVELPYETPGLVMFNWHIMGDGVLLQALREAQSSLDIERADDFDASFFGPLILDVVTDVWMLPEVPEIEVVVEDASGKVRKLASL